MKNFGKFKRFKRSIAGILLASVLLQPLGLVSVASAETVEMEYTDPDHIHAPKVVDGVEYQYDANGRRIVKRSGQQTLTYVNERYEQLTINNQQLSIYWSGT